MTFPVHYQKKDGFTDLFLNFRCIKKYQVHKMSRVYHWESFFSRKASVWQRLKWATTSNHLCFLLVIYVVSLERVKSGKIMSEAVKFCSRTHLYCGLGGSVQWQHPLGHISTSMEENIPVCINAKWYQVLQDRILTRESSSQQSPAHLRFLWKMAVIILFLFTYQRTECSDSHCASPKEWVCADGEMAEGVIG